MNPVISAGSVPVLRARAAVPVAIGAGLLLYLAFPGHDLWFLAPLGIAGLLVAVTARRAWPAAGLGLLTGLAFYLPLVSWSGIYLGLIAWIPLSVACALSVAVAAVLMAWTSRLRFPLRSTLSALTTPSAGLLAALLRALTAAGAWTAIEAGFARWPFGGFGWGRIAFSQADAPTLGLAALGGAPLVSFAVALTGALLAQGLLARRDERAALAGRPGRPGVVVPVTAVVTVLTALAVTTVGALVPRPTGAEDGDLSVAAVQGNVPRAGLEFNAQRRAVLDNHVKGTLGLSQRVREGQAPAPQLVVWPENSSDIDPLRNLDANSEIQAAADAVKAPIVLGAVLVGNEPGTVRNTSLVWEPDGTTRAGLNGRGGVVESYDKRHPVPFAEYIPYKSFFRLITKKVDLVVNQFVPGDRVGRLDAGGAKLGVMICFEVVEDGLVDDTIDDGADLLVVQTNNATFGYSAENVQQLAMSRLRAVEHGRAVVHVSTVGTSALVMPDGTLVDPTQLYTPAVISGQLPLRTSLSVADRVRQAGVPLEGLLSALGLLGAAGGLLLSRRRLSADGPVVDERPVEREPVA
ncbi:apolipoprotein N-acyltransferase [Quadrisphaera granulorum]|uniref:Apolipoprotein N-acyltransferase n=1 Tax=Quadrisphaera granulorum TaxID=317664 RepID=A0A316A8N0_9ACTN|nr:apolipoprotein N-acyltransferase [Quadrisphaera granulorum]PWJ53194.1 apolipoprotein N-acyltransferase [Quadrisphaera granulorum]SZE97126.1 apolipoprotein N-acyltransferase [Quadrisphaera granulorum]